jgi:hypothetical protein
MDTQVAENNYFHSSLFTFWHNLSGFKILMCNYYKINRF